ncbi:type I-E CRISPR-associated protein Cse1/CasA [Roseomonas sp. OT10]|uniref:type I-E CRISPR-associated protein Cse1/CasA n=1 Tax=Roseomonas cutis TaxID=2897332 RepID=UPI001E2B7BEB|nr:type I-E CRISPR-associated protein Cse1/CasA [Roseomonas sp. OT10]UFN49149.1 type I-E CRISPR-associated protein Cse1/CasA [Roseomonas sp. OT10]
MLSRVENLPFNLVAAPWLPVLRHSGTRNTIRPAQLTDRIDDDPIVALDWPRADFRVAGLEFLIGLLSTTLPPAEHNDWLDGWDTPPLPEALDAAFAPIAHAFDLDGPGPRFLQDREDLVSDSEPVERLLIESPGGSTNSKNTDLLVRRNRFSALGRPAAAMALYTFQSWAPAGGAGNRTGLRGGGPMVTLVAPGKAETLWHLLWANVLVGEAPAPEELPRVFPWLAPTLTSEGATVVVPEVNAHPLQCWWGMPRRIRLDFAEAGAPTPCDLTGVPDTLRVTGWRQRPRGANYAAWGGRHPLTPCYRLKPGSEVLPLHPQPGGVGYRHWLGLVTEGDGGLRSPAPVVAAWRRIDRRAYDVGPRTRLLAAGYDMDNMKARGFVESEMPLPGAAEPEAQDALARALVRSADAVAGLLRNAVRQALFSAGTTVKLDAELLASQRERLWERTEAAFFDALLRQGEEAEQEAMAKWLRLLRSTALSLFDEAAPLRPETSMATAAPRIAAARRRLLFALTGHGKDGVALFGTLGLPLPVPAAQRKGKAA